MTEVFLSCFQSFQCIAGACPDTCCAGWEIDVDEDALAAYVCGGWEGQAFEPGLGVGKLELRRMSLEQYYFELKERGEA